MKEEKKEYMEERNGDGDMCCSLLLLLLSAEVIERMDIKFPQRGSRTDFCFVGTCR